MMLIQDLRIIGEKLYLIRKKTGLSQEEVAWQAGLSSRTYADIERGSVNPRLESILKICGVLHITPDTIMTQDESAPDIQYEELILQLERLSPKEHDTAIRLLDVYLRSLTSD